VNLLLLCSIVVAGSAIGVGLMYAVRRWSPREHLLGQIEHGAAIFAVIGTTFAVVLAFVVLEAFDNFNEARTGDEEEASAVLQLSRNADFFPQRDRRLLEDALLCYARAVADDEWPLLADGDRSPLVDRWLGQIRAGLQTLDPQTPQESSAFLQLLVEQDARLDARRVRLSQAVRAVPAPVWFILGLGGGLTIAFLLLFADRRESFLVQGAVIGAISAMVVASLLLVYFLDHPYSGEAGSLEPHDMELAAPIIAGENSGPELCAEGGKPFAEQTDRESAPESVSGQSADRARDAGNRAAKLESPNARL
jgi:hypothetical protein